MEEAQDLDDDSRERFDDGPHELPTIRIGVLQIGTDGFQRGEYLRTQVQAVINGAGRGKGLGRGNGYPVFHPSGRRDDAPQE